MSNFTYSGFTLLPPEDGRPWYTVVEDASGNGVLCTIWDAGDKEWQLQIDGVDDKALVTERHLDVMLTMLRKVREIESGV